MGKYDIRFDVSGDTVPLIYLGEVYRIDLPYLLFLYEKYGKDLFFFFYLFSGKQISFPKATRFIKIMEFSQDVMKHYPDITSYVPKTEQGKRVFKKLLSLYSEEEKCFKLEMKIANERTGKINIKPPTENAVFDESASLDGARIE